MHLELAQEVTHHLARVRGVQAVVLGGSRARGTARPDSDVDIGIYYDPKEPLDTDALAALATRLDDRGDVSVTPVGGWGPWINGGAWLRINGTPVDWIYRDLQLVERTVEECRAGRSRHVTQPGHPHGFHTHAYLGELHHAVLLHDPTGRVRILKDRARSYPPLLRTQLTQAFSWQATFWLDVAGKSARRGDTYHVTGCLFQTVSSLIQVLYATNERHFLNEKGAITEIMTFPRRPDDFEAVATRVLGNPGSTAAELRASLEVLRDLTRRVVS